MTLSSFLIREFSPFFSSLARLLLPSVNWRRPLHFFFLFFFFFFLFLFFPLSPFRSSACPLACRHARAVGRGNYGSCASEKNRHLCSWRPLICQLRAGKPVDRARHLWAVCDYGESRAGKSYWVILVSCRFQRSEGPAKGHCTFVSYRGRFGEPPAIARR
jgi:hypothetical protein